MSDWEVVVGNIGAVYQGTNGFIAYQTYGQYRRASMSPFGRAAGECVVLFRDGEIELEYVGSLSRQEGLV